MHMHGKTKLCTMKRKHLRCVSLHCMTYLTCSSLCICTQYPLCNEKKTTKMCFNALHDLSNLFLVMYACNNYPRCNEKKTPKMCNIALHDLSKLFLVMHIHVISDLCAMKRKHLICVSLHCKIDITCFSLCICTQIANLSAVKRIHLTWVSVHCMTYLICSSLCICT